MENTLNILIVEDEPLAAAQLASLLAKLRPNANILTVCDTISSTCEWIDKNEQPDLAFFDIHLGDGLSFEIFNKTNFSSPVIFTTAYDQYALKAFKVNSIDYLLKPLGSDELEMALTKFEANRSKSNQNISSEQLENIVQSISNKNFKKRFLVKIGNKLKTVNTNKVGYFYSFEKGTYIKSENKDYLLDQTLEQIEQLIDPEMFFRINRKYIVSIDSIKDVSLYSNSRLKLKIEDATDNDFFVAREKVKIFKVWLEGEK